MFSSFSWTVAIRHIRHGVGQSLLTMAVVAVSVTLIIFLGALIGGLQRRLVSSVTGSIPLITIRQPERQPVAVWEYDRSRVYVGRSVSLQQQRNKIEDWPVWVEKLRGFDRRITAVSPTVTGQGFIIRGAKRMAVSINGVLPEIHNGIVDIETKLVSGRFFGLSPGEICIGVKLADDLGVSLGDKVRLTSSEDLSSSFMVAGLFESGFSAVDSGTVYLPMRDAQSLFALGRAVNQIGIKFDALFEANRLAARMRLQVPYEVKSWMEDNQQLLTGLRAQSQSSNMILLFTVIAAACGIASILITVVVSKLREIGILKAMGATTGQILSIFTIEGSALAFLGGVAGVITGVGLSLAISLARQQVGSAGRTIEVFAIDLRWQTVLGALVLAVVVGAMSSLYPAWRAAKVNPIDVIRGQ